MWRQRAQRRRDEIAATRIAQVRADANWVEFLKNAWNDGQPMFDHLTLEQVAKGLRAMADSMEQRLLSNKP